MKRSDAAIASVLGAATLSLAGYLMVDAGSVGPATPALPGRESGSPAVEPALGRHDVAPVQRSIAAVGEARQADTETPPLQHAVGDAAASTPQIADPSIAMVYTRLAKRVKKAQSDSENGGLKSATQKDGLAVDKAILKLIEAQRFWYLGPNEQMPAYSHLNTRTTRFWSTSMKDGRVMVLEMTSYEFLEVFENDPRTW